MSALAALTPPFLMCAAVVVAIVAFLRHEMGRGRRDPEAGADDNFSPAPAPADEHDDDAGSDAGASAHARQDG